MYIKREITPSLIKLSKQYPIITITGPRQSGKTTLVKKTFPKKLYVSFEDLDQKQTFEQDPHGFLERFPNGAIFDEVQKVPDIFSYLQGIVDKTDIKGMYILTGSQQFELIENISQSLAGRTAIIKLLPLSIEEVYGDNAPSLESVIYKGFYPRIFKDKLDPTQALGFYVSSYIERDVRQLINIQNLSLFEVFLKICAGRTGQVLNYAAVASECGIDVKTVKKWLSLLETSYIVRIIRPYYKNLNKRLSKSSKLYFLDVGLVCYLLGIRKLEQLQAHPLFGALFETLVISEVLKKAYNSIIDPSIYYYRDRYAHEVDLVFDHVTSINQIEIKSGKTINKDFFKNMKYLIDSGYPVKLSGLIYGGDDSYKSAGYHIASWKKISKLIASFM
jgi:uncharacterized protein